MSTKIVRVTMDDVYKNCHNFKDHTEYIRWRFLQDHSAEITDYSKISKLRSDTEDPQLMHFEYHGREGESIRIVNAEGREALSKQCIILGNTGAGRDQVQN